MRASTSPRLLWTLSFALALTLASQLPAAAQSTEGSFTNPNRFVPKDGATLYKTSCQACHMANGEAPAAGRLSRAGEEREAAHGALSDVCRHQWPEGHAALRPMMDDEQVAAVVNYIRTNLGNDYKGRGERR